MDKSITRQMELLNLYISNENAASSSKYDANANVSTKNIATLSSELNKFDRIMLNRQLMSDKITELFETR